MSIKLRPQVVAAGTRQWQGHQVQVYRGQVVDGEGQIAYTCRHQHPTSQRATGCAVAWIARRQAKAVAG
ncbi:MAG TPA: hypothetical protein VF017_15380 [Thermoanaerobaculia bacterium]|nr:hypothetical protein [Thermoanaerobaculia bacterium]